MNSDQSIPGSYAISTDLSPEASIARYEQMTGQNLSVEERLARSREASGRPPVRPRNLL